MQDHDQVLDLLLLWEEFRQQGIVLTAEELCRDFPQCLTAVQQRLAALAALNPMIEPTTLIEARATSAPADPPPASLGAPSRYREMRLHACGGLGEVYVAFDDEVKREVALKRMQARWVGDAEMRRRFEQEAEVTGRLEHPGVVPVYGLGIDADQRPYYAMRFIRGQTLQEAIEEYHHGQGSASERRLALRGLLARFVAVCQAVGYAHSRGIVHRDLKPANILLGPYGETVVVDWGLARAIGRTEADREVSIEETLQPGSRPGETRGIVGTPAYMSPEQAGGRRNQVGPASDVYGLGAVLYCLLTGEAPFQGRDLDEILERVQRGDLEPPARRRPGIAPGLDAICRKAMALRRDDRYPTAGELAADVERWLGDEPVRAHREGWAERTSRWFRHHRTVAWVGVALLLAGSVGLAGMAWVEAQGKQAAREEQERTLEALQTARDNLRLARQAVDECFLLARDHPLFENEQMQPVQRLLFERALPFYANFRDRIPDDPDLLEQMADQHYRVGFITHKIGRLTEAAAALQESITLRERLVAEQPGVRKHRQELAQAYRALGMVHSDLWDFPPAIKATRHALDLLDSLLAEQEDSSCRCDFALVWNNLGTALNRSRQYPDALAAYQQARRVVQPLLDRDSTEPRYRYVLGLIMNNLGVLYEDTRQPLEALAAQEYAVEIRRSLVRDRPDRTEDHYHLAMSLLNLALNYLAFDQVDDGMAALEEARTLGEYTVARSPQVTAYQYLLSRILIKLGNQVSEQGDFATALQHFLRARASQLHLLAAHPDTPRYRSELVDAAFQVAYLFGQTGRSAEAVRVYEHALEVQRPLLDQFPSNSWYRQTRSKLLFNLALFNTRAGQHRRALRDYQASRDLKQALVNEFPRWEEMLSGLADTWNQLGVVLVRLDRYHEGAMAFDMAIHFREPRARGGDPAHREQLADTWQSLGNTLRVTRQFDRALQAYNRAETLRAALLAEAPSRTDHRKDLGQTRHNRGLCLVALKRPDEAITAYREAIDTRRPLVEAEPRSAAHRTDLGWSHFNAGEQYLQLERVADARRDMARAVEYRRAAVALSAIPDSTKRDQLALACFTLGSLLRMERRPEVAMRTLDEARQHYQELTRLEPELTRHRDNLASTFFNLAAIANYDLQRYDDAVRFCEAALPLRRQLVAELPTEINFQANLAELENEYGVALYYAGRRLDSLQPFSRAITLAERTGPSASTTLLQALKNRASLLAELGDRHRALVDHERLLPLLPDSDRLNYQIAQAGLEAHLGRYRAEAATLPELTTRPGLTGQNLYNLACLAAICADKTARDDSRPLAERERAADRLAALAVSLLARAHQSGDLRSAIDRQRLQRDPDLDSLRTRDDFQALSRKILADPPAPSS
ncbi:MAG: protein kinase [Gemmataceae bacterium]